MAVIYAGPNIDQIQQIIRTELTEIAWDHQQAGQAISQYDVLYRDGSFWYPADAHNGSAVPVVGLGMAQDTVVSGARADIWIRGLISNGGWSLASGIPYFLASGGGIIASSPAVSGDYSLIVGRALTTTLLEFNPGGPYRIAQ